MNRISYTNQAARWIAKRTRPWAAAACLLMIAGASPRPAFGEITFEPFREFATNAPSPWQVEAGDMNSDGHVDLIVGGGLEIVSVMNGDGTGYFQPPIEIGATFPWYDLGGFVVADLDSDGDDDIAAISYFPPAGVFVYVNDGAGGFEEREPGVTFDLCCVFHPVAGDWDSDGDYDVAVDWNDSVVVLINDGAAQFALGQTVQLTGSVTNITDLRSFDMDRDGDPDLVVGSNGNPDMHILLNNGAGSFEVGMTTNVTNDASGVQTLAVADLNGDGLGEIVFAASPFGFTTLAIDLCGPLLTDGPELTLGGPLLYKLEVALGDLNEDGAPEAVFPVQSNPLAHGGIAVLVNDGTNGDLNYENYWFADDPGGIIAPLISDLDFDGDHDVAVINDATESVGVLINTSRTNPPGVSPCHADANDDGLVDPLDAGFVLSQIGCDPCAGNELCSAADVNQDLVVDPLDTGYVLARFGPCP